MTCRCCEIGKTDPAYWAIFANGARTAVMTGVTDEVIGRTTGVTGEMTARMTGVAGVADPGCCADSPDPEAERRLQIARVIRTLSSIEPVRAAG